MLLSVFPSAEIKLTMWPKKTFEEQLGFKLKQAGKVETDSFTIGDFLCTYKERTLLDNIVGTELAPQMSRLSRMTKVGKAELIH